MKIPCYEENCQIPSLPACIDVYPMYVDYEKSIWFDFSPDIPTVNGFVEFCEEIYNLIFPPDKTVYKFADKRKAVQLFITNLIHGSAVDATVAVRLRKEFFTGKFSYTAFKQIFDRLLEHKLIQKQSGYNTEDKKKNRVTRMWMSSNLRFLIIRELSISYFINYYTPIIKNSNRRKDKDLIQLRDKGKVNIELPENSDIKDMMLFLSEYNSKADNHILTLPRYEIGISVNSIKMFTPNGKVKIYVPLADYHFMNNIQQLSPEVFSNHSKGMNELNSYPDLYTYQETLIADINQYCEGLLSEHTTSWIHQYDKEISGDMEPISAACHYKPIQTARAASEGRPPSNQEDVPYGKKSFYTITGTDLGRSIFICKRLSTSLHRMFNIDMTLGGRFYGAAYQNIKKGFRQHLKINLNDTVERDFSAYHPRMLYHLMGNDYLDDPYKIVCQFLQSDAPELRKIVKISLNTLLNADSEISAVRGINYSLYENNLHWVIKSLGKSVQDIINAIWISHPMIRDKFFTGIGLKLMKKDSVIAEKVLRHFTDQNILCLCMHDSFIVEKCHEHELVCVMKESYRSFFEYNCIIK